MRMGTLFFIVSWMGLVGLFLFSEVARASLSSFPPITSTTTEASGSLIGQADKTWQLFLPLLSTGLLSLDEVASASELPVHRRLATSLHLPLAPRISVNGYASDYAVGQVDLMLPVKGDANHNLYIDPSVAYAADAQGYADLGLGYRWIKNRVAILGVYLFGGYSRIDNNAHLWVINPGLEVFGSRWDAHLNMYFPMGDRHHTVPLNIPSSPSVPFFSFTGHSEFLHTLLATPSTLHTMSQAVQYVGDGVDIKFGYQLFSQIPLKAYLGSYFFVPSSTINHILGTTGSLEYWLNKNIRIVASYSYDTVHRNTGSFGIGLDLGGVRVHRSDPSVEERMTDPVERNLTELGRGSGIPSRWKVPVPAEPIEVTQLLHDNMAFFSQMGSPNNGGVGLTSANCTFENPCGPTDLTKGNAVCA